jgi:UDP-N-acetylmuramate--alanine ligase
MPLPTRAPESSPTGPSAPARTDPFPWPAAHFVGVGGQSMSGLASALARLGVPASGSDVSASERTARAEAAGVRIFIGHAAAHVRGLPSGAVVVRSTDVPDDNPELAEARARGLRLAHRSEVLAWFRRAPGVPAVAVTGTHGKSTTTALAGLACAAAGLDPTVFVGADVPCLEGGNFRLGTGPVVVEADESDGSFLRYHPDVAVVTSLEPEHLEHYGGDFGRVQDAFRQFLGGLQPGALAILSGEDARLRALGAAPPEALWYGLGPEAELTAAELRLEPAETRFEVRLRGVRLGDFRLRLPGRHNVCNALAAIGAAWRLGCDLTRVADAFAAFEGAIRRFQVLTRAGGVTVVDDYAHNPTKVAAALSAARQRASGRVLAIFQPHRYNRTAQLWDAFGPAFRSCDALWLTDIYAPAGEARVQGVSGAALAEMVARQSRVPVRYVPEPADVIPQCLSEVRPGDLVIVMGAGSITAVAHQLAARLAAG